MRTIPHSIISGLLALALTLTAAPAPALATAPDDIVFSQAAHGDDPGDSEDLPIPEEDPARAKIGAVCYPTLSDALAAAVSGDTITLLEDAVLDGSGLGNTKGVLTLTQDLTIDGGGHTLTATGISYDTGSGGGPNLINVEEGARVILRDLTIDGGSQAKNGLNLYDSTAVLENVTVENCRWYAVVCNGSALEIHGLTTRGNSWGINVDNLAGSPSRFAMDAGTIGEEVSVFFQSGNAGVSDPTTGVISGGTYRQVGFLPETTGVELSITGGTFSFDPSAYTGSAQVQDNGDGTWTVHPSPDQGTGTPGGSDEDTSSPDEEDPDTPDGDSGSSGGAGDGSGDGSGGSTTTEKNPDGSMTTTVTQPDGTVTQTHQTADGVTGTTVTDASGTITEMTVSVPSSVATSAAEAGETVTLPVEVPAVSSSDAAPAVEISLPHSAGSVRVEIPVGTVTPGTVAVLVNADGTEEILKTSLPTEAGITLTLAGSATVKVMDNSLSFPDVHQAACWAQDPIDFVTSRQLFHGTSQTTFAPDAPTTRAQLMTVLARLDGAADLAGGSSLQQGMAWAVENGLTDGSNPSGAISRQQLAVVLYRYAGSPSASYAHAFPDGHLVADYAADAMAWAVESGIINGRADGTLDPTGRATRAQVAAMVQRYCFQMG